MSLWKKFIKAEAYRQLEISFKEREKNFVCLSYWDQYYFEEISEEPEFKAFYKKLGLEM